MSEKKVILLIALYLSDARSFAFKLYKVSIGFMFRLRFSRPFWFVHVLINLDLGQM